MKKILIIEDNTEVRENLEEILNLSGYEVITAENGVIGVEKALADPPNLILCDVMMPKLDGFGVLRILSKKPKTSDVPFVFLTAKAEKSDFRIGMNLGADDYISKPFDHRELLDAIEMRLKKTERLDKVFKGNFMQLKTLTDEQEGQKELEKLAETRESRFYHKKDTIFREGELPKRLFYVAKGKIKTFRTNEFGKDFITGIFKEGDFIGFNSLLTEGTYKESAVAMENAEVCFIPKEEFLELLNGSRDFTARFIKMLSNNISEKEAQLINLAYNSIRKRVADALVVLNRKYQEVGEVQIDILRDDLASMVGTTKESISRMLTDFKSEKLIEVNASGVITILQEESLTEIQN